MMVKPSAGYVRVSLGRALRHRRMMWLGLAAVVLGSAPGTAGASPDEPGPAATAPNTEIDFAAIPRLDTFRAMREIDRAGVDFLSAPAETVERWSEGRARLVEKPPPTPAQQRKQAEYVATYVPTHDDDSPVRVQVRSDAFSNDFVATYQYFENNVLVNEFRKPWRADARLVMARLVLPGRVLVGDTFYSTPVVLSFRTDWTDKPKRGVWGDLRRHPPLRSTPLTNLAEPLRDDPVLAEFRGAIEKDWERQVAVWAESRKARESFHQIVTTPQPVPLPGLIGRDSEVWSTDSYQRAGRGVREKARTVIGPRLADMPHARESGFFLWNHVEETVVSQNWDIRQVVRQRLSAHPTYHSLGIAAHNVIVDFNGKTYRVTGIIQPLGAAAGILQLRDQTDAFELMVGHTFGEMQRLLAREPIPHGLDAPAWRSPVRELDAIIAANRREAERIEAARLEAAKQRRDAERERQRLADKQAKALAAEKRRQARAKREEEKRQEAEQSRRRADAMPVVQQWFTKVITIGTQKITAGELEPQRFADFHRLALARRGQLIEQGIQPALDPASIQADYDALMASLDTAEDEEE